MCTCDNLLPLDIHFGVDPETGYRDMSVRYECLSCHQVYDSEEIGLLRSQQEKEEIA